MDVLAKELERPVKIIPGMFELWGKPINDSGWFIREVNGVTMGRHRAACITIEGPECQVAEGLAAEGERCALLALIDALHDAETQAKDEGTEPPEWEFDVVADLVAGASV